METFDMKQNELFLLVNHVAQIHIKEKKIR